jgi:hypothetical protein
LLNPQTNIASCCFLFLYSNTDNAIVKVAADGSAGDSAPGGGILTSGALLSPITQITSDGDVVFLSQLTGAPSQGGIFRWSRRDTPPLSRVVVQGDPTPSEIGGTFGLPLFGRAGSVSGRRLVFHAPVSGAATRQAIIALDDVRRSSPLDMRVVAIEGQATRTDVGGNFASSSGQLPFGGFGNNTAPPCIRSDGAVVFHSLLSNAQNGGAPTGQGVFLWNPRGFKKLAADGDRDALGQTMQGIFATDVNDIGKVLFFVASLQ